MRDMLVLQMLLVLLLITVCFLAGKIFLMKRAIDELAEGFAEKTGGTNTLLDIASRDPSMRKLADTLNDGLRELREKRQRYEQGDMELKNAVTNISHDLRTPLTAISGYLERLKKEDVSQNAARYIEILSERTEHMKQLTEELFRYSVIRNGASESKKERVSIGDLLEESLAGYYTQITARGITPKIQMPVGKVECYAAREKLLRLFENLIGNAVKYSDGDLAVTLTENGEVIFSNTAKNLSAVEVQRLFDRFYTVETGSRSTGLGLSIARELAGQMGGSLAADYMDGSLIIHVMLPLLFAVGTE